MKLRPRNTVTAILPDALRQRSVSALSEAGVDTATVLATAGGHRNLYFRSTAVERL